MKPETETKKRRERLKGMINNAETNRAFDLLRVEDSESQIAQRYLAVLANMCSDAGGLDRCTEVRLQLIRRFSALAVHAELMDSKFIAGKDVPPQASKPPGLPAGHEGAFCQIGAAPRQRSCPLGRGRRKQHASSDPALVGG
jgi:hypothetical protein